MGSFAWNAEENTWTENMAHAIDTIKREKVNNGNVVDYIMKYEGGNMPVRDYLELMGYMVRTGKAWQLQGSIYGRPAHDLIEQGHISKSGKINWKKVKADGVDVDQMLYDE